MCCHYQLAMVTGERCTIVFLPEKLKKHILKGGLYNEGGTHLLLFLFYFKTSWKNDRKNPEKIQHIMTPSQKLCLCPLPADITGYNQLSWSNNFEEKIFNPFWYTLNQQTFLFVMVEVKTDFLSKNPFSVFCKCSGITHHEMACLFSVIFSSSLVAAPPVQHFWEQNLLCK